MTHLFKFAHSYMNFNQLKIDISDFFCSSSVHILIVFHIVNRISFSMLLLPLKCTFAHFHEFLSVQHSISD